MSTRERRMLFLAVAVLIVGLLSIRAILGV